MPKPNLSLIGKPTVQSITPHHWLVYSHSRIVDLMLTVLLAAVWLAGVPGTQAQSTNTWTNTVNGAWSAATNWTNGSPLSGSNAVIEFTGTGVASYRATNDFAGGFTLNQLLLNSSSTATQVLAGNAIRFTNNGALLPQLLQSNSGAFTLSNDLVIGTDMTFGGDGLGTVTVAGRISSGGLSTNLIKNGAFTLVLAGSNSYNGVTFINSGVLNLRNAFALGSTNAGTVVSSGAALELQGTFTNGFESLTLSGTGITNSGALRSISGTNQFRGAITLGSDTRINADAGAMLVLNGSTISGAGLNLIVGGAGTVIISNAITTTTGGLIKDGTGTLRLAGTNNYSGATTVSNGTILLLSNNVLGLGALNISGGTVNITNRNDSVGPVNLTNGSIIGTTGILTGTVYNAQSGLISAILGGAANFGKTTTNTVILSGASTFTGTITNRDGGVLEVTRDTALGNTANAVIISNNSTLRFNGSYISTRPLTIGLGGGTIEVAAGRVVTNASTGGINAGANTFTKTGNGTLVVTNNVTRTGSNVIRAGTLELDSLGALGSNTHYVLGGTLANGTFVAMTNNVVLAGGTLGGAGDPLNATGRVYNGRITLLSNSSFSLVDTRDSLTNIDLIMRGVVTGAANAFVFAGPSPSSLVLTNAINTITTNGQSGTWTIGSNASLISGSSNGSALGTAKYILNDQAFISIRMGASNTNYIPAFTNYLLPNDLAVSSGSATVDVRRVKNNDNLVLTNRITLNALSITNSELQVVAANAYSLGFSGPTRINGTATLTPIGATLSLDGSISEDALASVLVKNGANTLFLTNLVESTYSGGTIVNGGTLIAAAGTNTNTFGFITNVLGTGDITLNGGTLSLRSDTNQIFGPGLGYNVTAGFNPTNSGVLNVNQNLTNGGVARTARLNNLTLGTNWFQTSSGNNHSLLFAGTTLMTGNTLISNAGNLILDGLVTDSGSNYSLLKSAGGRLFLTNFTSNTWSGGTILRAGQLQMAATNGMADNAPLGTSSEIRLEGGQLEPRSQGGGRQKFGTGNGYNLTIASNATLNVDRISAGNGGIAQFNHLTNAGVTFAVSAANAFTAEFVGNAVFSSNTTLNVTATGPDTQLGLQFAGDIQGSGLLRKTGTGRVAWLGTNSPSYTGNYLVDQGYLAWRPTNGWANTTNATYNFGPGLIQLDGGGKFGLIFFNSETNRFGSEFLVLNGIPRGGLTNQGGGAIEMLRQGGNPQISFTNKVTLAGPLVISYTNAGNAIPMRFTGPMVVRDEERTLRVVNLQGDGGTGSRVQILGNLTNDGMPRSLTLVANNRGYLDLLGNNAGISNIFVKGAEWGNGGRVRFGTNTALPSGRVSVGNGAYVALGFDPRTAGFPTLAALSNKFTFLPGSVLGLDATTNGFLELNLGPTGLNQDVRIGVTEGVTRTNTLAITPFTNVFKLVGGGGTLVLNGTNQLAGPNSLSIGSDPFTVPIGVASPGGSLTISLGSNTYTGPTIINPSHTLNLTTSITNRPVGFGDVHVYAVLNVAGRDVSLTDAAGLTNWNRIIMYPANDLQIDNRLSVPTNRLGDAEDLSLNGGLLRIYGNRTNGVTVNEAISNLNVRLGSRVILDGEAQSIAQLTVSNIARVGSGTLQLLRDATITNQEFGNFSRLVSAVAPATNNGMVAPWMINGTDHTFLTYDANGFTNATIATTNINVATLGTEIVELLGGTNALTIDPNLWALRTSGQITNAPGATITINSGGLVIANTGGSFAQFNFAGQEALVYVNGTYSNYQSFTNAAGITKFGEGTLRFNVQNPGYTNGWNINRGNLTLATAANAVPTGGTNTVLGELALGNVVALNGNDATLQFAVPGTNILFSSGKIITTERNVVIWDPQANDIRQFFAPLGLEMNSLSNTGPLGAVLRVDLAGNARARTVLEATGPLALNTDSTLNIRNTSVANASTGGSNRLVFSGGLVGTARTLTKMGNGVLEFEGDNSATFTGGHIQVNGGTLSAGHNGAFGNAASTVTFASNTVLELNASLTNFVSIATIVQAPGSAERWLNQYSRFNNTTAPETYILPTNVDLMISSPVSINTNAVHKTIRLNGGTIGGYEFVDDTRALNLTNNYPIQLAADSRIGQSSVDIGRAGVTTRFEGIISEIGGARSLTKVGLDTVVLATNNTYTGATVIREGTLRLGFSFALNSATSLNISNQAILDLGGFPVNATGLIGSGMITNSTATAVPLQVTVATSNRWLGAFGGPFDLVKAGPGDLTLEGTGDATGSRQVYEGTLYVAGNTIGNIGPLGSASSSIILGDNPTSASLITTGPFSVPQTIRVEGNFSGGSKILGTVSAGTTHFSGNVTLVDNLTITGVTNSRIDLTGNISESGGVSLTKTGKGVLNLTGNNQYSGSTTVSDGTLLINNTLGSATGTGLVFGDAGTTIGGSGRIAGALLIGDGGSFKPGNSAGAIRVEQDVTFASTATVTFEIGGLIATNQHDFVSVGGTVNFGGTLALTLINSYLPATNAVWTVMSFNAPAGNFGNALTGARVSTTDNFGSFRVSYGTTNLTLDAFLYTDTDLDGIYDAWAFKHFGLFSLAAGTNTTNRFGDFDRDGQNNYGEFIAGTNPTNDQSYLHITSVSVIATTNLAIRWDAAEENYRTPSYQIEYTTNFISWQTITNPTITPFGGGWQWIDNGTETGGIAPLNLPVLRSYKVQVK